MHLGEPKQTKRALCIAPKGKIQYAVGMGCVIGGKGKPATSFALPVCKDKLSQVFDSLFKMGNGT